MALRAALARLDRGQLAILLVATGLLGYGTAARSEDLAGGIDPWLMTTGLLGGLALFLFGMEQMAEALKAIAGERMREILRRVTTNRFAGALTGALVTAVIQSSSVTTVLVVGFITAGLMSMSQSIGVIMGANIGTTITAQIVAFKVTKAALLMIGVGFFMLFGSKNEKVKHYGGMVMGLGLIFLGMSIMSDTMKPLRSYQPFLDLMATMSSPWIAILVAAAFTGLVQSSSATTGIVIVMASQGFVTLPMGIALAFGSNVGTCVTAMLASIGKPREAVRAGLVHVIFNVAGVLLWLAFIPQLAQLVTAMSPASPELTGTARLAAEVPRQIANAHTMFNIANTVIFIGFAGQLARLVEWLVPDRPLTRRKTEVEAKYLDAELLLTPAIALDRVRLEIGHMGEHVSQMLDAIMPAIISGDRAGLSSVERMDDDVDRLHGQILQYLSKISKGTLTEHQTAELLGLMEAVVALENIGDVVETNLVVQGRARVDQQLAISPSTQEVLLGLHAIVHDAARMAIQAVAENDVDRAIEVTGRKAEISKIAGAAAAHQAQRLVADEPNRIAAYTIEMDILEKLKRIYYFSKRMSKTVEATGPVQA